MAPDIATTKIHCCPAARHHLSLARVSTIYRVANKGDFVLRAFCRTRSPSNGTRIRLRKHKPLSSRMALSNQGPSDCFRRALNRFLDEISQEQRDEFENCTLKDVHDTIEKIQAAHGSERRLRNMNRVRRFLEGMEQIGKVVDVFLNSTMYLGFVWVKSFTTHISRWKMLTLLR